MMRRRDSIALIFIDFHWFFTLFDYLTRPWLTYFDEETNQKQGKTIINPPWGS